MSTFCCGSEIGKARIFNFYKRTAPDFAVIKLMEQLLEYAGGYIGGHAKEGWKVMMSPSRYNPI